MFVNCIYNYITLLYHHYYKLYIILRWFLSVRLLPCKPTKLKYLNRLFVTNVAKHNTVLHCILNNFYYWLSLLANLSLWHYYIRKSKMSVGFFIVHVCNSILCYFSFLHVHKFQRATSVVSRAPYYCIKHIWTFPVFSQFVFLFCETKCLPWRQMSI